MIIDFILIKNILSFIVITLLVITIMNWKVIISKDENFYSFFEIGKKSRKRIKNLFFFSLALLVLMIILIP